MIFIFLDKFENEWVLSFGGLIMYCLIWIDLWVDIFWNVFGEGV